MTTGERLVSLGYRIEERGSDDSKQRPDDSDKLIVWWKKGSEELGFHWKCDGPGPKYFIDGVCGPTLDTALQRFIDEITYQIENDTDLPFLTSPN